MNAELLLLECPTYESYLDTFVRRTDKCYLRNDIASRVLVTLGYRTTGAGLYSKTQFYRLKSQILRSLHPQKKTNILFSYGISPKDPVIKGLAQRELPNIQKAISTIIFIRYRKNNGFEISSFLDYEHSLRHRNMGDKGFPDWRGIFAEHVLLVPHTHDLSFYSWQSGVVRYNNSDNYILIHDREHGLLFLHRGDHKKISIDPSNPLFNMNSDYTMVRSDKYGEVIFYDHVIRSKKI